MIGYIYALKDRGFDRGVKIGRDKNHPDRFKRAQCYSPRGLDLVAVWPIEKAFQSLAEAERTARDGLPSFARQNAGTEWRDLNAEQALEQISVNLAVEPSDVGRNPRVTSTYDDFRDPKHVDKSKHRQALWVYRENQTGHLKVQRTHSWKVPQEAKKTYSLLGFQPIGVFLNGGKKGLHSSNQNVHEAWARVVQDLGYGVDHIQVGWLRSESKYDAVRKLLHASGLVEYPRSQWRQVPSGFMTNR